MKVKLAGLLVVMGVAAAVRGAEPERGPVMKEELDVWVTRAAGAVKGMKENKEGAYEETAVAVARGFGWIGKGVWVDELARVLGPVDPENGRGSAAISMMMGLAYEVSGEREKGRAEAREWEEKVWRDELAMPLKTFDVIRILAHAGDFEEAERMLGRSIGLRRSMVNKMFVSEAVAAGDKERAEKYLAAAIAEDEGASDLLEMYGVVGDWTRAEEEVGKVPKTPAWRVTLAWQQVAQGFAERGDRESMRKAVEKSGEKEETYRGRVERLAQLEDWEGARALWKKGMAKNAAKEEGETAAQWLATAELEAKIGEIAAAKKMLEQVRANGGAIYRSALLQLAAAFYGWGDRETAEALMEEEIKVYETHTVADRQIMEEVRWNAIGVLVKRGEVEKAAAWARGFARGSVWAKENGAALARELARRGDGKGVTAVLDGGGADRQYVAWALAVAGKRGELAAEYEKLTSDEERAYFALGVIEAVAAGKRELPRGLRVVNARSGE